ncbi:MAG: dephospho-CoA kinase [Alphaproteobacteria bacterium]
MKQLVLRGAGMRIVGLTGAIGSGKSTASAFFKAMGVGVHDADEAVHRLLETSEIRGALRKRFPLLRMDPRVDRRQLAEYVFQDPDALRWLEELLHPLVRCSQMAFLKQQARLGKPLVVLDVPLLFETHQHRVCDWVVVMKTPPFLQSRRVLSRKGMTPQLMRGIQAAQGPVAEKVKKADTVLMSGLHKGHLFRNLKKLFEQLQEMPKGTSCWKPGWKQNQDRKRHV